MKVLYYIIFLLIPYYSIAQETIDRVYLKNNTIVTGKIIEKKENISVKIEEKHNKVRTIPWEEISSINENAPKVTEWNKINKRNLELYDVLDKGVIGDISIGYQYLYGSMIYFSTSLGYQINPHIAISSGLGVEALPGTYLPVFLELKYNVLKKKATPFIFLRPGYMFTFMSVKANSSNSYKLKAYDGAFPFLGTGIGFKYKFNRHIGLNAKIGYQFGYADYTYRTINNYHFGMLWSKTEERVYHSSYQHAINFAIGFEF